MPKLPSGWKCDVCGWIAPDRNTVIKHEVREHGITMKDRPGAEKRVDPLERLRKSFKVK